MACAPSAACASLPMLRCSVGSAAPESSSLRCATNKQHRDCGRCFGEEGRGEGASHPSCLSVRLSQ
eukprot:scaffold275558_cov21-Tisochrysis_lutea.AAC.3